MILLDWEKAFDKVSHEWLFHSLEAMCIPRELMDLIRGLYKNLEFYVEIDKVTSKTARQETGIRQGYPLSPYLFILVMDRLFSIIPHITEEHKKNVKIPKKKKKEGLQISFQALLYANDTILFEN